MINDIPAKIYKGISFAEGDNPNFKLLASYFIEQGLFINNKGDSPVVKTVSAYVAMLSESIANGNIVSINESELSNNIQVFGNVAQINSEYELIFEGRESIQTRYGVNLFQLINIDGNWLISSMCWDDRADKSLLTESV